MKKIFKFLRDNLSLLMASIFISFTFFVYAPFSIYLSNRADFWFNISDIAGLCFVTFLLVAIGTVFVGWLISLIRKEFLVKLYNAFLFAIGICVYVQGNFLGIDVGTFNGSNVEWGTYSKQMTVNVLIWAAITVVLTVVLMLLKKKGNVVVLAVSSLLVITQTVALVSLFIPTIGSSKDEFTDETMMMSDYDICEMGAEDNVIVFVLDTFDTTVMEEILEKDESVAKDLKGFTFYDNYTPLYMYTCFSLTNLINGGEWHNYPDFNEWIEDNSANRLYIDELVDNGYDISIYTCIDYAVPTRLQETVTNINKEKRHFRNLRTQFVLINKMVACQWAPDAVKPYVWLNGNEFNEACIIASGNPYYSSDNRFFRDSVKNKDIVIDEDKKYYKLIHTEGSHEAFMIDENGDDADTYFDDYYKVSRGCFRLVQNYLDKMKEAGTYDSANIIITGDHGWRQDYFGMLTSPPMLIKEAGADFDFARSEAPVSQSDFQATVLKLAGVENYADYGTPIMDVDVNSDRVRYYYPHAQKTDRMLKFEIAPESNEWNSYTIMDEEYLDTGEVRSHFDNCATCQSGEEPTDFNGFKILVHREK